MILVYTILTLLAAVHITLISLHVRSERKWRAKWHAAELKRRNKGGEAFGCEFCIAPERGEER